MLPKWTTWARGTHNPGLGSIPEPLQSPPAVPTGRAYHRSRSHNPACCEMFARDLRYGRERGTLGIRQSRPRRQSDAYARCNGAFTANRG
jgi:hypothetical protein